MTAVVQTHTEGLPRAVAVVPPPRTPMDPRCVAPAPGPSDGEVESARSAKRGPGGPLQRLVEVAVWTSCDGAWQEHATFLLRTADGNWHGVGFSDPGATDLVSRLRELPGFDTELLLELIGQSSRRVVTLWREDVAAAPR